MLRSTPVFASCHMTRQETLRLLWEKYVHDQKLDAAQLRQLRDLVQDPANQPLVAELLDSTYSETTNDVAAELAPAAAFHETWEKLQHIDQVRSAPVVSLRPRSNWRKYAAAAVLVLAIGFTMYRFTRSTDTVALVDPTPARNDDSLIAPGGNKATLTLADGSVVSLNDQANGVVASQGATSVVKLSNGELAYQVAEGSSTPAGYNSITTPRGGKYQVALPDGSKVWMNAESSLRYPTSFSSNERIVELTGEAYFEVAHNPSKPFHVMVNKMDIKVLGTHFNVMAYANEDIIATTLVEGSVQLNSPLHKMQLKPGQQGVQPENGVFQLNENPDIRQVLAWKNDYFQFNNERVDKLMRQLERWYDVSVVYENGLPDRKFGGKIPRSSPLKDVLKALELSDVKFRVSGKTITVINN
ncbi:MAG: FecR family protein [Chitinophagaceae bacterium]|nr:MAG: FecR family protein [Chitinophagaceae bacterium]